MKIMGATFLASKL